MVVGRMLHHHLAVRPSPDPVEMPVSLPIEELDKLHEFVMHPCPRHRAWVLFVIGDTILEVYMRHSVRMHDGVTTRCIDVANVIAEPKETGAFTRFMQSLERMPVNIYVENVFNRRLEVWLEKRGYRSVAPSCYPRCYMSMRDERSKD